MRVGCRMPAKSKLFVAILREWKLPKTVTKSSILDVTVVLDSD